VYILTLISAYVTLKKIQQRITEKTWSKHDRVFSSLCKATLSIGDAWIRHVKKRPNHENEKPPTLRNIYIYIENWHNRNDFSWYRFNSFRGIDFFSRNKHTLYNI